MLRSNVMLLRFILTTLVLRDGRRIVLECLRKRHNMAVSSYLLHVVGLWDMGHLAMGRCNREKPPCKYFHPPQHLKDQLLINGRNHLALKNALMQQMGISPGQPVLPGQVPAVNGATVATTVATAVPPAAAAALGFTLAWGTAPPPPYTTYVATNPYLASMPASTYSPYFQPGHLVPTLLGPVSDPSSVSQLGPVVQQAVVSTQQKIPRSDRLETAPVSAAAAVAAAAAAAAATMGPLQPPPPPPGAVTSTSQLSMSGGQSPLEAFPGMVPFKRSAGEKSGIPVYQPGATYQQLMQLQQPFVPVSCEYPRLLNNNSPKMSNKNAPLVKSMSLQSMASLGGSMSHLAANGQAAHSESDLKEAAAEKDDTPHAGDLLTPSSGVATSSAASTAGSVSLAQSLATSSTQAVTVPVTSPLMQYSAVASSNHQAAASMQAQFQAAQVAAAAQHAHAVQAAQNQNAALVAAAAAAAATQYPAAGGTHYTDAASMAKEVAHKNYALKLHGGSTALTGKPLTALGYTGVALNKGGLLPQPSSQQYAAAAAAAAAASVTNAQAAYPQAAARLSAPATPQQTMLTTRPPPPIMPQAGAYQQFLRPQMPAAAAAFGSNPYAAAVAQQQLMNQSFMYPGAPYSVAAAAAGGYHQFPMAQAGIPSNLTAIPTPVPQVSATPTAGSAVVLNPYKKMKTS
uniref:Muscleblind-like CCCH zinc finger domain-containing protein n=1 Tax=Anopheles melas TaxID=34690 RepID=A0A182UDE8_9DIPT